MQYVTKEDSSDFADAIAFTDSLFKRLGIPKTWSGTVLAKIEREEPIWFGPCANPYCDSTGAYRRRQNTAYDDDGRNFATLCDECQEESNLHYQAMWDEYHSVLL